MLQRTNKISNKSDSTNKETLAELLARLGVTKVKSYPCTPEVKSQKQPQQPELMKL